jgi:hypothetical protein
VRSASHEHALEKLPAVVVHHNTHQGSSWVVHP